MTFDATTRGARVVLALLLLAACHRGVEPVSLVDDLVTLRDRWLGVATLDGETVVVVGYGGKILRSDDGGERWTRVEAPTDRMLARVAFADREHGWIVGQGGVVLHTADGGRSWQAQESGTRNHLFGLSAISPRRVVGCGDRSQWIETSDGGATWSARTIPLADVGMDPEIALAVEEPIYYDTAFVDENVGWLVGDYGNVRFTSNGGRTWQSQHGSLLGQRMPGARRPLRDALDLPALFRVGMLDRERGWVVGVGGVVLRTTDGGARWEIEAVGIEPRVEVPLYEIAFAGPSTLVLGEGGVALAREADGWRRLDLRLPLLTWIAAAEFAREGEAAGRRGFAVGGRGLILRTDDGGASWRPLGSAFAGVS